MMFSLISGPSLVCLEGVWHLQSHGEISNASKKTCLLNSNDLAKLLHLCWEVERNHEFPTHYHRYDKNAQNGEKCDGEVEEGVPTLGL